ncbi:hypothetical protein Tco_0836560, partial [Tanacetum coccineum]
MDYFISMQLGSNVRFSALFLDLEEKSSVYTNDFPSMILQKNICVSQGGNNYADNMANEHVPSPATTRSDDQILLFNAWVLIGKALTASADVPSSFTVTTETTSTL